jgi:hypothetical protein
MDTKTIFKYLAIAVGAYLLYEWLSTNGYLAQFGIGTSTAAGTTTTGTGTAAAQITGTSASNVPTTSTSSVQTVPAATGVMTAQVINSPEPGSVSPVSGAVAVSAVPQSNGYTLVTYSDGSTAMVSPTGQVIPLSGPSATPSTSPSVAPAASEPTSPSQSTVALVAAMSQGDSFLNGGGVSGSGPYDHWNYYYNQTAEGKTNPAPSDDVVGVDPNASITLQQWWQLVSVHGISGLRGFGGYSQWGIA